jgi:hypothetical protein
MWITALALLAVVAAGALGTRETDGRAAERQRARVEQAIRRAAVQCYALEGAYPPTLDYLKDHYGLCYDERRFVVYYKADGANLTPVVMVVSPAEDS